MGGLVLKKMQIYDKITLHKYFVKRCGGFNMASEMIEKITLAENKATENIQKAEESAKKIISDAKRKADSIIKEACDEATKQSEEIMAKSKAKSDVAYASSNKKAEEDIKFLKDNVEQRKSACIYSISKKLIPENK
jgi:vacuolar-type H+-ATPase subunit H